MEKVYVILFVLVLLSELFILFGLLVSRNSNIRKLYKSYGKKANNHCQFLMIVPMFDESVIAKETYDYFCGIATKNVHCVFITSEKETNIFGRCKTREVLENCMKEKPNKYVHMYHNPEITGNKVGQLNRFLSEYKSKLNKENVFIIDYDCDSRPDKNVVQDFCDILNSIPQANVMQQSAQFWSPNKASSLLNVEALYQTRWSLGYERCTQYLSTFRWINRIFVPFYYCVGHGLCIRASYLYQHGLFPSPLEDLPLGMMLMLLQEPIYPCVTKDKGEVVLSFKALLRQAGHWIRGPLQMFNVLKRAKQYAHISVYRQVVYLIRMGLDFVSWIQYLLLLLVSVFMVGKSVGYIVVYILFLYMTSLSTIIITIKLYCDDKAQLNLFKILLLPVRHFIRGFSMFSCFYQHCFGWFYDKKKNV